jgi:hypothetical protein
MTSIQTLFAAVMGGLEFTVLARRAARNQARTRLRAFRQRQRLGQSIYRLTLDAVNLEELLIAARTLRSEDRDTHSKVELALTKFIELMIADHNAALG